MRSAGKARHDAVEQAGKVLCAAAPCGENLVMAKRLPGESRSAIGDERDGENAHVELPRGNHFRNRGHSDGAGSQSLEGANLGRCLVLRPGQGCINTFKAPQP